MQLNYVLLLTERSKDSGSPDAEESLDKGDTTIAQASLAQTVTSTASGNVVTTSVSTGVTTRRTLRSHTNRNQNNGESAWHISISIT